MISFFSFFIFGSSLLFLSRACDLFTHSNLSPTYHDMNSCDDDGRFFLSVPFFSLLPPLLLPFSFCFIRISYLVDYSTSINEIHMRTSYPHNKKAAQFLSFNIIDRFSFDLNLFFLFSSCLFVLRWKHCLFLRIAVSSLSQSLASLYTHTHTHAENMHSKRYGKADG